MKTLFTLLCCCFLFTAVSARNTTYEKLTEVNACWKNQPGVNESVLPAWQQRSETEWIKLHLQLVEQTLRQKSTAGLSARQKENRLDALDHLHQYWIAGQFPVNDKYTYRTPIFIDRQNNFCAVGYLVKASGHEEVSRMIAAKTNLAYVKEMNYPELNTWAATNGFTREELAWIQPAYPPVKYTAPLGKGVNGEVIELFPDGNTLYVGGSFTKADSTISVNNIAYVTEAGGTYTWHAMNSGVNGPVHAIAKFNNRIYIAGEFTMAGDSAVNNIAYWDQGRWHNAGCLYGKVKDLIVFRNNLYAAGSFDVCAGRGDINFARLNGNMWQSIPDLSGRVNTMEVKDTVLLLGGAFTYNGNQTNLIKWTENAGFSTFAKGTRNEINDLAIYKDTVYAAGKYMAGGDSAHLLVRVLDQGVDTSFYTFEYASSWSGIWHSNAILNTLLPESNSIRAGGNFYCNTMHFASNNISFVNGNINNSDGFYVNNTINKLVYFKNDIIIGGLFDYGKAPSSTDMAGTPVKLNGIAKKVGMPVSVPSPVQQGSHVKLYPQPAGNGELFVENNLTPGNFVITDMSGRSVCTGSLRASAKQKVMLPSIAPGIYLFTLKNQEGAQTQKVTIE